MIPELHIKVRMIIKAHPEYTLSEIGHIFGLTRQRIHQVVQEIGKRHYKLKQKGIRRAVLSKSDLQTAIKNKIHQADFIREHGTSTRTLKVFLDMYGLVWPSNNHNEKVTLAALKKMLKKHPEYCLRELAEHFDVSEVAISNRIKYHGLAYTKKV